MDYLESVDQNKNNCNKSDYLYEKYGRIAYVLHSELGHSRLIKFLSRRA